MPNEHFEASADETQTLWRLMADKVPGVLWSTDGALRFTTQHINVTAGAEQVYLEARDMDDETRFFANLSYKLGKPYPLFP